MVQLGSNIRSHHPTNKGSKQHSNNSNDNNLASSATNKASASSTRVLHQTSELAFTYSNGNQPQHQGNHKSNQNDMKWGYRGRTTLWVIHTNSSLAGQTNLNAKGQFVDLALHFRGQVEQVSVATVNQRCQMTDLKCDFIHLDTLKKVMVSSDPGRIDADSQCSRGASFGLALRASAAASFLGELRIKCDVSNVKSGAGKGTVASTEDFVQLWRDDICFDKPGSALNEYFSRDQMENLKSELLSRDDTGRQSKRIGFVARKLGETSSDIFSAEPNAEKSSPPMIFRITITFGLPDQVLNFPLCKGISFNRPTNKMLNSSPFVYTTSGEFGDHEGPRMWIPCLDSTSGKHRSSHELCIHVSAPSKEGLVAVGCGEDAGVSSTIFNAKNGGQEVATMMLISNIWSPMPARCLGFAIGPFKILSDLEYITDTEEKHNIGIGEGIRQAYIVPLEERPFIHSAQTLDPSPERYDIELTISASTSGVPLRALNVAKEVVGLPFHQTSSYIQVWLPNVADGGSSSGSLQQCGVATNCWIGGAILDSSLLPPPRKRFPFYRNGRALLLAQARCVMTSFVRKGVALGGGQDDVGEGWMHALFVSELMKIYELAHGGQGQGGGPNSSFFIKTHASKSGPNSEIMEFMNFPNVESDTIRVGSTQGEESLCLCSNLLFL